MRRLAAGIAVVVGVAAGCGGGRDELSEEEFRERANAVCAEYERKLEALGRPESVDEVATFASRAADLTQQGGRDLRAI